MPGQSYSDSELVLKLAFLWHQHQPYYKDFLTCDYILHWVRLHAIKDYLDMVEILDGYPGISQTFNMVPSLLEQLLEYADGRAVDRHLALSLKKAEELTEDDKSQMLTLLFQANYANMVAPVRRYDELFRTRHRGLTDWTDAEWRDLQALANLAWIDPMFKSRGRLKELAAKGERYTEDEKQEILAEQRKIITRVIPSLKEHMESGQIEVSVSPYFHPILPLLCDTSLALEAMPDAVLPQRRFQHPEDAAKQIEDAVALYVTLFGRQPQGMWPSEGSVSQDVIPIIQKYGFKWIASDEEILAQSLGVPARSGANSLLLSGALYKGYEYESQTARMAIFFRDHALSDNIGFVYSSWRPDKAADDFVSRLASVAKIVREKRIDDPIISIILDGENTWEYYRNDGHDFLAALYAKIEKTPWLKTITFSDYLAGKPRLGKLKKLFAGSWINHSFGVWIGHAEDNKAWDLLGKARDELEAFEKANPLFNKEQLELAWKEIMIAEGSDWCWWFGEEHLGPYNDDFDRLFRMHLANAYMLTGREPLMELFEPIRSSYSNAYLQKPVDYIKPVIDGKMTHFYEWQQAGFFDCSRAGTTMHKAEHVISGIWFGFDTDNLYFRLDHGMAVSAGKFAQFAIELEFHDTTKKTLRIDPGKRLALVNDQRNDSVNYAMDEFLEISLPLELVKGDTSAVSVRVTVLDGDRRLETWPQTESIRIELPGSAEIPWAV